VKALLAAVVAILGALLVLQWKDWPPPPPAAGLNRAVPADAAGANPADRNPLARLAPLEGRETYASVNDRTLFRPQRKPPEPQAAEPEPAPEQVQDGGLEGLDLTAVVITPQTTEAWVVDPAAGLKRLKRGDPYADWTVKDITPDTLVLERQGKTNTVDLYVPSQASPLPAPGPAPTGQRPPPVAPQSPQPPQGALAPRPDRRVVPPRTPPMAPPARPNVPRPVPQRPK
jgi:general secretion pathway protein N